MPDERPPIPVVPESQKTVKRRARLSLVWVVPIIAAAAGLWVAVTRILGEGPKIEIVFATAEGLEAGKTQIHYNGVDVGTLTTIRLSDDHRSAIATAQMAPRTEDFLVEDTEFWVVKPRISGANVTGLGTLISGSYIGMEIGQSRKAKRKFVALVNQPVVTGGTPGRFFKVKTSTLGSLDSGTPIYFRRLQVGEVASYALDKDGQGLSVRIFVNAPYDQYVNENTRFWNASGIDMSLTAEGLSIHTQSIVSILVGGIAFETPPTDPIRPPAEADTEFTLFDDRAEAFKLPSHDPQLYKVIFDQSVRGLNVGAPVEFRGIPIGEVTDVAAQVDAKTLDFSISVTVDLDAQRLGVKVVELAPGEDLAGIRRKLIDSLVSHGMRAQLRSGSLLTGALFVAVDLFPDAAPASVDWSQKPPRFPTVPGQLEALEASVVNIIHKLEGLPLEEIGADARKTLAELDRTLAAGRVTLDNAGRVVAPDSVLRTELSTTLEEVSRAARGVRVLADYLERHPESLIRGKTGGPE